MKAIVFTAKSDYARFRCPYTTTSALTFLCIHPIATKGLVGAIMGVDYKDLYEYTQTMKIGIQVLNPIYKDTQAFNLIAQANNNKAQNFQSRVQFLRDVKYRIFVQDEEEKLMKIGNTLKQHNYVFTPYLGCSEHIAKVEYEGIYDIVEEDTDTIHTIIDYNYVDFNANEEMDLSIDRIPTKNGENREYTKYQQVVIAPNQKISIKLSEQVKVGEQYVFFF